VSDTQRELETSQERVRRLEKDLQQAQLPAVSSAPTNVSSSLSMSSMASGSELLPPGANPGQCFARVYEAPTYETEQIRMLKKASSERIEIIPAKYEWVEQQVLVKEAYTTYEIVPEEYEWTSEQVLVKPAHTVWKKGRGPIEKLDDGTGEIMCLTEVPAEYKTVRSRVLKSAQRTRPVEVPAEYKTVKVRKLASQASEKRTPIPAEYQTVTQRRQVADGRMAWRPVLCETNATRETVRTIQTALYNAGHSPGPIDGIIGRETLAAVKSYQTEKGLASGGLTYATIDSLGVKVGR